MLVKLEDNVVFVKNLKEFVNKIPSIIDECPIECTQSEDGYIVSVIVPTYGAFNIECGDHIPPDTDYDLLVELHSHD